MRTHVMMSITEGEVLANFTVPSLAQLKQTVDAGLVGASTCTSRQTVAIIIPFRNRHSHLRVLLRHLLPILQRQQIEYRVYVVELVSMLAQLISHVSPYRLMNDT